METVQRPTMARLLTIAFPMIVSQASDTFMLFVDRLFLARLGEEYLAASMSGGLTSFMFSSFFIGTVGYGNAIVAQYYGAGRKDKCAAATFQALLLALACYPVLLALSPLARGLFLLAGHEPLQARLGYTYFSVLVLGSVFLILRHAVTGFFLGIGRTRIVMYANLAGMLLNVPANYVLIYGKFGFPALGLRGAAIGTILGNLGMLLILLAFYLRRANRIEFATHRARSFRPDLFRKLIRFGTPAGAEWLLNVAAFNLFVLFMHSYGTAVAAAVTITFNWDMVAFVPMTGLGFATTALVGQNVGAGDHDEARRSAYMALRVGWIYSSVMACLFLFANRPLVTMFASSFAGDTEHIVSLARTMLRLAAIYTLADSAQLVFAGALRGAGDTTWVMRISVSLHWVFTILALLLIRVFRVDPVYVWIAFIGFVVILGMVIYARFRGGRWRRIRLIDDSLPAAG